MIRLISTEYRSSHDTILYSYFKSELKKVDCWSLKEASSYTDDTRGTIDNNNFCCRTPSATYSWVEKKICRLKLVCFFFSFSFFSIWLFSKKALRTLLKGAAVRLELSKLYKAYTLAHGGRNPSSRLLKIRKWNICQKSLSLVTYHHGMINEDVFGYVDVKVIIGEKRSVSS